MDGAEPCWTLGADDVRTLDACRRWLTRKTGDPAVADDLVGELCLKLLRYPPPTGSPAHRRNYIWQVCRGVLASHCRAVGRDRMQLEPDDGLDERPDDESPPEAVIARRERRADIDRVVEGLAPHERDVLLTLDLRAATAAAQLGLSTRTLCQRRAVLRRRLRNDPRLRRWRNAFGR